MAFTARLIARLLFVTLLFLAAPFSLAGERVVAPETAAAALAETGQGDARCEQVDASGQPGQDDAGESLSAEPEAQECALLVARAWCASSLWTAAVDVAQPSLPCPALAALDRPPRGR